jgi:hypothetical protein
MAQIAAEVRRGHARFPNEVNVTDLIVELKDRQPEEVDWEAQMNASKAAYAAMFGSSLKIVQGN